MKTMSNRKLEKFVSSRSECYRVVYKQEDYKKFLERSELFLEYSVKLEPLEIDLDKKNYENKLFFVRLSRICLGIACELLVKSAYLKEGYIINISKGNIKKPLKFIDLERYNRAKSKGLISKFIFNIGNIFSKEIYSIQSYNTHSFNFLLKYFYNLFKLERKVFNFYIARGLKLAHIWRNVNVHIGHGKVITFGDDYKIIYDSIINIYKCFFEEEDLIRVKKLINY